MSHESLAEISQVEEHPPSFTFAVDAARTADELPDYEALDEQDNELSQSNIPAEDSTFALIFKSPVRSASTPRSRSPTKVATPAISLDDEEQEMSEESPERFVGEELTVTGPTIESVVTEVVANVSTLKTYVSEKETLSSTLDKTATDTVDAGPDSYNPSHEQDTVAEPVVADANSSTKRSENCEYEEDSEMSEVDLATFATSDNKERGLDATDDAEVTEASLQLDIQEEYEREGEVASQPPTPIATASGVNDITDGLTLAPTPSRTPPREHTPKKLLSPPPPLRVDLGPEDATMTLVMDDDTAILKSFLSRAAASKAERSAMITRRSSLENRRDSDIVRHALASPRKVLEEKDTNSPTKIDSESTLTLTDTMVAQPETEESASPSAEQPQGEDSTEVKAEKGSRRSSRAKKSRLPAPAAAQTQTNKIAIRRADGTDPVVLKKTDAQELALITRNNTRKNKQGAFMVSLRLLKLQAEAILAPPVDLDAEAEKPPVPGRRGIRWDETLAYYQEHADSIAAQQAEAESLATPDELSLPVPTAAKRVKAKTPADKNSTPKIRRARGLGTANGTPGKGLLETASLLPDAVQEEKAAAAQPAAPAPVARSIPKPRVTKKLSVPSAPADSKPAPTEVASAAVEPPKERKSRIAPPKSVRLPKPVATAATTATAEKENTRLGLSGATPRKGIPAPRIVAPKSVAAPTPSVGVESGLPRRRGRKV